MLNQEEINNWKELICDRYSPEELIELLGVSTGEVFERFLDECLELSYEEIENYE